MRRRNQFNLPTGFTVISVPESGLFAKDGRIVTGHGTDVAIDELYLFKRREDAVELARSKSEIWGDGDKNGMKWEFLVVGVLVRERL